MSAQLLGKVFLVGAGPGDPELITLKGKRCLEAADVILFDELANHELLAFASADTQLIYVGKKPGKWARNCTGSMGHLIEPRSDLLKVIDNSAEVRFR